MYHQRFSQLLSATLCMVALTLATNTAQASFIQLNPNGTGTPVRLSDLVSGQVMGVSVGDKNFDEFFYSTLNEDMPPAEDISVLGFQDLAGHYGLTFHGGFLDLPGGRISDAQLGFTVTVSPEAAAQGFRISDAHLFIEGVGLGNDSFFSVDESFAVSGANEKLNAYSTTLNGSDESVLSDWVFFDELYTSLRVTKDILAIASANSNQPARATVIRQSFSQVQVPEPATIGLVALAVLGIVASRREY